MRIFLYIICSVVLCIATPQSVPADILEFLPAILAGSNQEKSHINVIPSGPGSFSSNSSLAYDYDTGQGITTGDFIRNGNSSITLTAIPKDTSAIITWDGCESVSAEARQCTISLAQSRMVRLNFESSSIVYKQGKVVDLSSTTVVISGSEYFVSVDPSDTKTVNDLQSLQDGDFITSHGSPSFLQKIASIRKISTYGYSIATVAADLSDIIAQGSYHFSKVMTYADFVEANGDSITTSDGQVIPIEPDASDSTRFTMKFSRVKNSKNALVESCLKIPTDSPLEAEICGELDIKVRFDYALDYWIHGLKQFRFIPEIETTNKLTLKTEDKAKFKTKYVFTTIEFPRTFLGIVWIDSSVRLSVGAESEFGIAYEISNKAVTKASAGITYDFDRTPSWNFVHAGNSSNEYGNSELTVGGSAKLFITATPGIHFLSATGPAVDITGFAEMTGEDNLLPNCDALGFKVEAGLEGYLKWDLADGCILGKFKDIKQLAELASYKIGVSPTIKLKEWSISDSCPSSDKFNVKGDNFNVTCESGSKQSFSQVFSLGNKMDVQAPWSFRTDGKNIRAQASSGFIPAKSTTDVKVTADSEGLDIGEYINNFSFKISNRKFDYTANTTITPPKLPTPQLNSCKLASAMAVELQWNNLANANSNISGYDIYESTDSFTFQKVTRLGGSLTNRHVLPNRLPKTQYWYAIVAYGNNAKDSQSSNVLSITTRSPADETLLLSVTPSKPVFSAFEDISLTVNASSVNYIRSYEFYIKKGSDIYYSTNYNEPGNLTSTNNIITISQPNWPAGRYDCVFTVVDSNGNMKTKIRRISVMKTGDKSIHITEPSTTAPLVQNGGVTLKWTSSGIDAAGPLYIDLQRDASIGLEKPDNHSWYRFTDNGSNGANDGIETVHIPANLAAGYNDWRFVISDANSYVFDATPFTFAFKTEPEPINWLTDTGQSICYDNTQQISCPKITDRSPFFGQDAHYTGQLPSFRDNGDGTVTDLVTGLMWQKEHSKTVLTLEEAETYCENMIFPASGHNDWRLPTISDFFSLNNFSHPSESLVDLAFVNYYSLFWSSTRNMPNGYYYKGQCTIDLFSASIFYSNSNINNYARCVRGTSPTPSKLIDNGDETLIDPSTNLMWSKTASHTTTKWDDALTYCKNFSKGGFTDWRLPSLRELESIIDYTNFPMIKAQFTLTPINQYYNYIPTSTTYPAHPHEVYKYDPTIGVLMPSEKVREYILYNNMDILCVRGGISSN